MEEGEWFDHKWRHSYNNNNNENTNNNNNTNINITYGNDITIVSSTKPSPYNTTAMKTNNTTTTTDNNTTANGTTTTTTGVPLSTKSEMYASVQTVDINTGRVYIHNTCIYMYINTDIYMYI